MALIWFEGFETCGTEVGSGNAATIRPRVDKRILVPTGTGTGNVWLVPNDEADGFGLCLGTAFNNRAIFSLVNTILDAMPARALGPIVTVGARIHVPSDPNAMSVITISYDDGAGGSVRTITAQVIDSANVAFRVQSTNHYTVNGVVTPGGWHYFEIAVRGDGGIGHLALAEVASQPSDDATTLSITNFRQFLPVWRYETTYEEGDQVRWMGRAYECLVPFPGDTTGDVPDENPSLWSDIGAEEDNTSTTNSNFQPTFYILEDPQQLVRNATGGIGGTPPSSITVGAGQAFDHDSGVYIPQPGDTVVIGCNSVFEIRIDGTTIIKSHLVSDGNGNMGFNNHRVHDSIQFSNTSSITGSGDDFFAIDDIYLSYTTPNTFDPISYTPDFRGPARIVSIPPNEDVNQEWTPSTGSDHYPLIDENGADSSDYVEATTSDVLDQFGHTGTGDLDGEIHAVRIEVEAINTSSGSPTLEVSMGESGEISDTFVVDNTSEYELFTLDSTTKPGGGSWTFEDVDDLVSGIEASGL